MESTVGAGSLFWVELNGAAEPQPAVGEVEPLASIREHVQQGVTSHTLLYVADNRANMAALGKALELPKKKLDDAKNTGDL